MAKRIYTAGYGNLTTGEWRNLLKSSEIELVIDVRRKGSKSWKGSFNAGVQMEATVDPITYMQGSVFGNTSESLDIYATTMTDAGILAAIEAVAMSAMMCVVCLICCEKHAYVGGEANCHRVHVAEAVVTKLREKTGEEWQVVHLPVDIEVLRQPQQQALTPCDAVGCVKKGNSDEWESDSSTL